MNKRKRSLPTLFFVIVFFVYFVVTLIEQQKIIYVNNVKANDIQSKIQSELRANEELKKYRENLDSDEYIEKIAREKLGMIKPGERIFFDIDR
jgi:cell division protein FtsL